MPSPFWKMKQLWKTETGSAGLPQWLVDNGRFCLNKDKVPYRLDREHRARPNVLGDFASYQEATKAMELGKGAFGLSLGLFDVAGGYGFHLCGIDIDGCVDGAGQVSPFALEIIRRFGSYAEISPSGTGIHVIFGTKESWDKEAYYENRREVIDPATGEVISWDGKPVALELYSSANGAKALRVSGNPAPGSTGRIVRADEAVRWLLDAYMRREAMPAEDSQAVPVPTFGGTVSDWEKRDPKLKELYEKTTHGASESDSQVDMALCCKLAFWTGKDTTRMDALFRASPWYVSKDEKHKAKWERTDYREGTLANACKLVRYQAKPTDAKPHRDYTADDTGNAQRFVDEFGGNLRYNVENKQFMIYNGEFWQTDMAGQVRSLVEKMTEEMTSEADRFEEKEIKGHDDDPEVAEKILKLKAMRKNIAYLRSKKGKDNCLSEAQHIGNMPVANSAFDCDGTILVTKGGTYDLKTGLRRANSRDDMATRCIPLVPEEAKPTRFLAFLSRVLSNHPETMGFVHRMLGYCITGETMEQKIFFLYGDGNDGKSVLMDTVSGALGDYAGSAKKDLIVAGPAVSNQTDNSLARIKGKRLVTIDEMSGSDRLNEGLVKAITSGTGEIAARYLYANEFTYRFNSKIVVTTNYEPRITGIDRGIWRRIVVLPFDLGLKDSEVDKTLKYKLQAEWPRVLWWLIQGAKEYYAKGLSDIPACSAELTSEYRKDSDVVQQWLDEECEETDESRFSKASELFDSFTRWCIRGNQPKISQTQWGRSMGKKLKKARVNNITIYYGVRLSSDKPVDDSKAMMARAMAERVEDERDI